MTTLHFRITNNPDGTFKTEYITTRDSPMEQAIDRVKAKAYGYMSLNIVNLFKDTEELITKIFGTKIDSALKHDLGMDKQ